MAENDQVLKTLMAEHNLSYKEVAAMLDVSLGTVQNWTRPDDNAAKRNMPSNLLELLKYKLRDRQAGQ